MYFRNRMLLGALISGLATAPAHAVFLNPAGLGQALIFPYYVANGATGTLVSVSNTTGDGKALKIRFLEGYNGRDVLTFNLYLSPYDVWVAEVFQSGSGAALVTSDNSCSVPRLSASAAAPSVFSTGSFDGSGPQGKDGGPPGIERTLEGHIEIVEMGTVTGDSLAAIGHLSGTPDSCQTVVDAWKAGSGYWTQNPQTDISPPSGGLNGSAAIINVGLGTVEAYVAEALGGFYAPGGSGSHTSPTALDPTIASGSSTTSTIYANEVPLSLAFAKSIDAVSSLFMADAILNDFVTSSGIGANSEWVITYPTKRFYTDPFYVGANALPPFDTTFGAPQQCLSADYYYFDREENRTSGGIGQSIPPPPYTSLCNDTQTLTFRQGPDFTPTEPSVVLGSNLISGNLAAPFADGWAKVDIAHDYVAAEVPSHRLTDQTGRTLLGQPVVGFLVEEYVNGNVSGALANYTSLYRHKVHTTCKNPSGEPCS